MQILRRTGFRPVPWKNGGGVTHEALRVPLTGDSFRWRVSIAQVESSGEFSDFSGYRRTLVLLEGGGVMLNFADGREVPLQHAGDLVHFDGATSVLCTLSAGPCTDLNLIVSQSLPPPQAWVAPIAGPQILPASPTQTLLVVAVAGALKATSVTGDPVLLGTGDLAVIAPGEQAPRLEAAAVAAVPLAFFALVDDNPA